MKTRSLFLLTLLIVLISSCAQDEMLEKRRLSMISSQDVTFNASFDEESTESRTFIEEDAETSKLYLRWTKGDEISIFRGTTLNQRFQFKGETGDNSGSFKLVPSDDFVSSNELEESRNYAFYPYDEYNKISEKGELAVTLPATQTYAENSFGPGANTMIALTKNTGDVDLKFKNIGGYFKFKFYGNDLTIKSVTLKGNNGEKLAGKAGIACQYGDAPIVTMAEEATETLTLNCGAGIKVGATKEEATEFWFVLPPTKFTKGFTITVTDVNDGTFTKTTEKVFEIKRNTIKPISTMKVETVVDWEAIYAKERAALIDLYNATDGNNWKNNTNWCSDLPIDEWYGVNIHYEDKVNSNGRVSTLDLYRNQLTGNIPESIGNLTNLKTFNLEDNQLSGSIPESIGNLTNLTNLRLVSNQLNGNIPESIGNLTNLTWLNLGANYLTGEIPESIGNLTNLTYLGLHKNQLSGNIPESIGNLTNLTDLALYQNQLAGEIPATIGNLTNLTGLDLRVNQLYGSIPESIGNLTNLTDLSLCGNELTGEIPETIGNLTNLTKLELYENQLSGKIPESIGNLTKLKRLWLDDMGFTGEIPKSIGNLTNLTSLYLQNNNLTGEIPESIGNLTKLTDLQLSSNQLSGSIPESIGNLTNLISLGLEHNQLTGEIPESIGNLKNLEHLSLIAITHSLSYVETNKFSGNIPESIGNLTKLDWLWLKNNQLSGSIPESIGNLTNLTEIRLENNQLSGSIPESIGNLTSLRELDLANNQLGGSIPETICNLNKLKHLDLSNNKLTGSIPEMIANMMSTLYELKLFDNQLTGKIPASIFNHKNYSGCWMDIVRGNNFDGILAPTPDFRVVDLNGIIRISEDLYAKNELTVLFQWATYCGFSKNFIKTLNNLYAKYKDNGLGIIGQVYDELGTVNDILNDYGVKWPNTKQSIFAGLMSPRVFVVDKNKQVVFETMLKNTRDELPLFVENYLGTVNDDFYTSSDYTRDGEVVTLQKATVGRGINLTFLGEAFVDKDMETNGHYEQKMREAMEEFFSVEPYKSMRNRFNVYTVKVVSPNAEFSSRAEQRINENDAICFEYAQKIPNTENNLPMVTVIYNASDDVGRSYCRTREDESFVSYIKNVNNFGVIPHETGGHGFAHLFDEYVEAGNEELELPEEGRLFLDNVWPQYGRGANVDWRSDENTVKWAHFLKDSRYANEGLGLYEGSYLYGYGAYRPTENSMMRYNDSPFNAPSREQIYKRIMQRSEGPNWKYDYEKFVEYDAINRNAASRSASRTLTESERQEYIKNHQPPTFIKGTWRDAMKNGKSNIVVPLR